MVGILRKINFTFKNLILLVCGGSREVRRVHLNYSHLPHTHMFFENPVKVNLNVRLAEYFMSVASC